jgi:hypothetical protein
VLVSAAVPEGALVRAIDPAPAVRTALEAGISLAEVAETVMRSVGVPEGQRVTTDRARAPAATGAPPAWDPGAAEALVGAVAVAAVVVEADGADNHRR